MRAGTSCTYSTERPPRAAGLSPNGYVRPSQRLEVIEDLPALHDAHVTLRLPREIKEARLEPDAKAIEFTTRESDGGWTCSCHAMIALQY